MSSMFLLLQNTKYSKFLEYLVILPEIGTTLLHGRLGSEQYLYCMLIEFKTKTFGLHFKVILYI